MPKINQAAFTQISQPLLSLTVQQTVNSFGSAIHLKLNASKGVATINFYWDWRLEDATTILCGSSNRRSEISGALEKLVGLTIAGLAHDKPLPDLSIVFSNGWRLRSMSLVAGSPQWHITLPDQSTLGGRRGRLLHTLNPIPATYHPDPLVDRISDIAMAADRRWLNHPPKSSQGDCADCQFFVRLDGPSAFLWYGACASGDTPFDGRVVHQGFGCAGFCPAYPAYQTLA